MSLSSYVLSYYYNHIYNYTIILIILLILLSYSVCCISQGGVDVRNTSLDSFSEDHIVLGLSTVPNQVNTIMCIYSVYVYMYIYVCICVYI
jgi:hypothetical protein